VKLSEGVEWGVHCCVLLGLLPDGQALPAGRLAEFHGVPAAYLAKHLQALSRAGILDTTAGPRGGYRLARAPADVSLLQVVEAIEGRAPAFRCAEIRQRGPAAISAREYRVPCAVTRAMHRAESAWRAELAAQTLADLLRDLAVSIHPRSAAKAAGWLQEVFR
jgi:Rrf2 family protein